MVLELKAADFQEIIGPLLHILHFTEWANAPVVVSGDTSSAVQTNKKSTPPKLGPRANTGSVFSTGSPLEEFRSRKVIEYEARLRRLSSPGKVFAYFATAEDADGAQMMTGADLLKANGVLQAHAEIDALGKEFIALIDTDGDGLISYAEFVFFRALLAIKPTDLEIAFQMFDRDESGSIDREEFAYMFATLSGSGMIGQQWKETASVLDGPVFKQWFGDGSDGSPGPGISFAEFSGWLMRLQAELVRLEFLRWATDSSGDGKVDSLSASDFGRMIVQLVSAAG